MAQDAEQLKAQIAQTREDLDGDLDVLAEKVTPSKVVGRRVDAAKGALTGMKEKVMGSADSLRSSGGDAVGAAGSAASDRAHQIGDAVQGAPAAARARTSGNPFAAGVVAFGVGLLVASLFPAGEAEQRGVDKLKDAAKPMLEPLKEQASEAAGEIKDNLAPAVKSAADSVQQSATEAAGTVKDTASQKADTLKESAADSADTVKGSAADSAGTVKDTAADQAGTVKDTAAEQAGTVKHGAGSGTGGH